MSEIPIDPRDEPIELVEQESHQQKVVNLLELTRGSEEWQTLSNMVEKNQGVLAVAMHPFYHLNYVNDVYEAGEGDEYDFNAERINRDIFMARVLKRLINRKEIPVVVFEERLEIDRAFKRLKTKNPNPDSPNIFMVPTVYNFSTPITEGQTDNQMTADSLKSEQNWDNLADILKALGVNKIIVGGMYLGIASLSSSSASGPELIKPYQEQRKDQGAINVDYDVGHCIGELLKQLAKRGIIVELSNFSYENRRRIREIEGTIPPSTLENVNDSM